MINEIKKWTSEQVKVIKFKGINIMLCNVGTGSLRAKCFMTDDFEIKSDDMKSESDPIQRN